MAPSMLPMNPLPPLLWGIQSSATAAGAASSSSRYCCGFVRPSPLPLPATTRRPAMLPPPPPPPGSASTSTTTTMRAARSAEWIDLLSSDSYHSSSSISLPGKIEPPRSGAVSFSSPGNDRLFTFAGYAEMPPTTTDPEATMPERYVVNDLWKFDPYQKNSASSWGWKKVDEQNEGGYIPGPRLATAAAVLPSPPSDKDDDDDNGRSSRAVLLGGWDPQTPGTGGIILDDVSMLDLDTLEWSRCARACVSSSGLAQDDSGEKKEEEEEALVIPGGPTSRHVAVPLSIKHQSDESGGSGGRGGSIENVICLHNHRCEDSVLILSNTAGDDGGDRWEERPTTGDAPSSRGLHCAAQLDAEDGTSRGMVVFGGAAKDGNMSNEAFVLDVGTWRWTALDCGEGGEGAPVPRAGACLCPLNGESVLLFGGATPGEGGLLGLNDVWVLHVDMERGTGEWQCLVRDSADDDDGTVRPPGRNAATLSPIDARKLLPKDVAWKGGSSPSEDDDDDECYYFLLQGGWYPFRKTYNDVYVLRVSPN